MTTAETKYREKKWYVDIINLHFIFVFINQRPRSSLYLSDKRWLSEIDTVINNM